MLLWLVFVNFLLNRYKNLLKIFYKTSNSQSLTRILLTLKSKTFQSI